MDPEANLNEQLELARNLIQQLDSPPWCAEEFGGLSDKWGDEQDRSEWFEAHADLGGQLAELVLALDEWRRKGGFDPYSGADPLTPSERQLIKDALNAFTSDQYDNEDVSDEEESESADLAESILTKLNDPYSGAGVPDDLVVEIRDALEGDSNDAEHDALASVAEHFGIKYKLPEW